MGCTLPFPGLIFLSLWETRGCKDGMQEFLYILTSIRRVLVVVGGWEDNVLVCVFSDLQTLLKLGLPSLINCISPCKCGVDACSIRHQTQVIFHRSLYKEKQRTHRIESENAARNRLPRQPLSSLNGHGTFPAKRSNMRASWRPRDGAYHTQAIFIWDINFPLISLDDAFQP